MKLSRIRIKNYRDVEILDLRLDQNHAPADSNHAERKNLLEAADLILGETWPLDRSFSEEVFYDYDTNRDLIIQVYFDEEIEEWRYRYLCKISGFELRVRATAYTKENRAPMEFICIGKRGRPCHCPVTASAKGEPLGTLDVFGVPRELWKKVSLLYLEQIHMYKAGAPKEGWPILEYLFRKDTISSMDSPKEYVQETQRSPLVARSLSKKEIRYIQNYFENHQQKIVSAKGMVFVEGATEKTVFFYAAKLMGMDKQGISIVDCGGKSMLYLFAHMSEALNIPYVVVADTDIQNVSEKKNKKCRRKTEEKNKIHQYENNRIKTVVPSQQLFWMTPDIERVMGYKEKHNKVKHAKRHMENIRDKADLEPRIRRPLEKIQSMIMTD